MVTSCTTTFNMWKFYVSPTQCIYASLNILDQTATFLPTNINWLVSTTVTPFRLVMRCLFSVSLWRWHRHGIPPPKKKTSSFKHAAWSKDSILCFWRDTILASDRPLPRQRDVTASHFIARVAARTCCAVNVLTSRIYFFSRDLGGWGPWSSIIC
jgi:hypothetical protein